MNVKAKITLNADKAFNAVIDELPSVGTDPLQMRVKDSEAMYVRKAFLEWQSNAYKLSQESPYESYKNDVDVEPIGGTLHSFCGVIPVDVGPINADAFDVSFTYDHFVKE